jgi:hypothetical protein
MQQNHKHLKVQDANSRESTIWLMTGCHELTSHAFRYDAGSLDSSEACGMCQAGPEDPFHVLELCKNLFLSAIREDLIGATLNIEPSLKLGKGIGWIRCAIDSNCQTLVKRIASYIAQILDVEDATEHNPA